MKIEKRVHDGWQAIRAADGTITGLRGYAAVFDKPSLDLGGFTEVIRKGAFARSLADGADVLALAHHDSSLVLGRRSAGSLKIEEDDTGLRVEISASETSYSKDTMRAVSEGLLKGMSFGFITRKDAWTKGEGNAPALRELLDVDVHEVSVVAWPAYPDTTVAVRSLQDFTKPARDESALLRLQNLRFRLIALKA